MTTADLLDRAEAEASLHDAEAADYDATLLDQLQARILMAGGRKIPDADLRQMPVVDLLRELHRRGIKLTPSKSRTRKDAE